jgi:hypothetical protein
MSFSQAVSKIMSKTPKEPLIVCSALSSFILNRDDGYARDGRFHPSYLYYMCPRCEILKSIVPVNLLPVEKHDLKTKAKFDIGHALHWWYQNKYLGPMRVIKGVWECHKCGGESGTDASPVFMPYTCDNCGSDDLEYRECRILSEEWNIAGKTDGILVSGGEDYILDIKTSDPDLFLKLYKPWPSHIYQVNIYMWLSGIKKGVVLYVDKSSNDVCPAKEFILESDSKVIVDVKGKITSYNLGMKSRTLPDCLCSSRRDVTCSSIEKSSGVSAVLTKWRSGEL